jgi:hypothetical protein
LVTGAVVNMYRRRGEVREKLFQTIELFRKKGATSPKKAMTAKELGLPPRFEEAMKKRLGKIGIFIKENGKYYLSENKLKEIKERFASRRRH